MSRAYSEFFTSDTVSALTSTTALESGYLAPAGISGARKKQKIIHGFVGTAGMTSGDELRLCSFHSSVRVTSIKVASDGGSTTYAADLGLYLAGTDHTGAVIDDDLYSTTALAMATGFALTEEIVAGALTDEDIGKPLWAQAAVGAASYTSDPDLMFDLVLTSTATGTGAINEYLVIVEYVEND